MNITNTTRTMPKARYEFLRFQVGRDERRNEQIAIYKGKKIVGYENGPTLIPTFRLLGWGSTKQKAERMAKSEIQPPTVD